MNCTYVGLRGTDTVAAIHMAIEDHRKKSWQHILSARINSTESWTYGYFEARLRVPGGKEPGRLLAAEKKISTGRLMVRSISWSMWLPPNVVPPVHTGATTMMVPERHENISGAEPSSTSTLWSGLPTTSKASWMGRSISVSMTVPETKTWPFNVPFYLKLNLAWGGDWGGAGCGRIQTSRYL